MSSTELILSTLAKTWIFDLDGTIVKHNGYKTDGEDSLLPGAKEYLEAIPPQDKIIIFTSRREEYRDKTLSFWRIMYLPWRFTEKWRIRGRLWMRINWEILICSLQEVVILWGNDHRVYMQLARAILEEKDIVLKTRGTSMGNYCAIDDAVEGIWTILWKGKDGETYNVVNEANTMRIRDMAELVAEQVAGGKVKVRVEAEDAVKNGYAPDTGLRLSGKKLQGLGWRPTKGLVEMYQEVLGQL